MLSFLVLGLVYVEGRPSNTLDACTDAKRRCVNLTLNGFTCSAGLECGYCMAHCKSLSNSSGPGTAAKTFGDEGLTLCNKWSCTSSNYHTQCRAGGWWSCKAEDPKFQNPYWTQSTWSVFLSATGTPLMTNPRLIEKESDCVHPSQQGCPGTRY